MGTWLAKTHPASPELFFSRNRALDPRLGDIIKPWDQDRRSLQGVQYALIGFPEDRGVRRNFGKPGAALGPTEFRRAFYRLTAKDLYRKADFSKLKLLDLGDLILGNSLEEAQQNLGEVIHGCREQKIFPIVIGGGHETAYGHFLGYKIAPLHILNIDSHLDVRPLINGQGHSGSSFRQMIEAGLPGKNLTVFGLQGYCNSEPDLHYAQKQQVKLIWLEEILKKGIKKSWAAAKRALPLRNPLYVTLCLDAIRASEFPATSAAPAQGFTLREILELIELIALQPNLASLDLVEFSPPLDTGGISAKAAALLLYRFLAVRCQHARG